MKTMTAHTAGMTTSGAGSGPLVPRTHGAIVAGWLLVCFSIVPLAMAAADRKASEAWFGAGLLAAGVASVVIGGRLRAR